MTNIDSYCALSMLLLVGKVTRIHARCLHSLYLPSCVIGGIYGLLIIQIVEATSPTVHEYLQDKWVGGWEDLPGFLINLVFASLFLGSDMPSPQKVWEQSSNQLMYGLVVSLGQMLVGFLITGVLLIPVFDVNPLFAQTLPIGFEGGHGTAAALRETLTDYGYADGGDVSLGMATVGILFAVTVGIALVNLAARRGWVEHSAMQAGTSRLAMQGLLPPDDRPIVGFQTVSGDSIDTFAWHLVVVGCACLIGVLAKLALVAISEEDFKSFPLFPLCMMGGMSIQTVLSRYNDVKLVDKAVMERIAGTALDFLIVAAVATVDVSAIADSIVPFLIIVTTGLVWNVFAVLYIGRVMNPTHWFENSICVFGQSTGVIAAGLMLLRMVDPESKTPVPAAFGYKQLVHATFMGGGFVTAFWVPLQASIGLWPTTAITAAMMLAVIIVWAVICRPKFPEIREKWRQQQEQQQQHAHEREQSESCSASLPNGCPMSDSAVGTSLSADSGTNGSGKSITSPLSQGLSAPLMLQQQQQGQGQKEVESI